MLTMSFYVGIAGMPSTLTRSLVSGCLMQTYRCEKYGAGWLIPVQPNILHCTQQHQAG